MEGGTSVAIALQKEGIIAGLSITKGGQLRINAYNTTDAVVYLTPKTAMVHVWADKLEIKYQGQDPKILCINREKILDFGEKLCEEIRRKYPKVGDFSTHPINDKLARLGVRSTEVRWDEPQDRGLRTQYKVETVADRRIVHDQLQDYVQRGYLNDVSVGEDVYFNPLLPVRKPNGTYRFTNDFRRLNSYFPSTGETSQVDVWRKMWELHPKWKYFMEIDLKDGFFGISVDEKLSKLFGFTYGARRYRWNRLPQGWKWSMVLFHERAAEIVQGIRCLQYADNVLVGAETLEELRSLALQVFARFDEFGIKVNYDKVKWVTKEIEFLGREISNGYRSHENFLKRKRKELGEIRTIKDLERIIGVISYARRCVKDVEVILGPLREDLKEFKAKSVSESWINTLNQKVDKALALSIENVRWLILPGVETAKFTFQLESDWSSKYAGYMLFACKDGEERLVDMGSRAQPIAMSSYLGELDALVWACKRTKAFHGDIPLVVRTDNQALVDKWRSQSLYDNDIRVFRRWEWLLANEPGMSFKFIPGSENTGADLLSRPNLGKGVKDIPRPTPSVCQISIWDEIWAEHMKAHWGPYQTYAALHQRVSDATWRMVKKVCEMCEVCAKFQRFCAKAKFGQPPFSLEPGHTMYGDVVGPLPRGKGGALYIHCLVDSATRVGDAVRMKIINTASVIKALRRWIRHHGQIHVLMTDNAAYYTSAELAEWCGENRIEHGFIAPYRHQSVGIVERYHQTLIDRIRKLRFINGGSWTDYLEDAVKALNEAKHSVMRFTPFVLWYGTEEMRRLAFNRTVEERAYRNRRRNIQSAKFFPGQIVLVWNADIMSNRFQPKWRGPYVLTEQV